VGEHVAASHVPLGRLAQDVKVGLRCFHSFSVA
jgi:hypothetical protein